MRRIVAPLDVAEFGRGAVDGRVVDDDHLVARLGRVGEQLQRLPAEVPAVVRDHDHGRVGTIDLAESGSRAPPLPALVSLTDRAGEAMLGRRLQVLDLRLEPRELGLERGALVNEPLLEDRDRRIDRIVGDGSRGDQVRPRGSRSASSRKRRVEGVQRLRDVDRLPAGEQSHDLLRGIGRERRDRPGASPPAVPTTAKPVSPTTRLGERLPGCRNHR